MISVITCSTDDRRFAAVDATYRAAFGDEPYELIRIPDATSLAAGYNAGLAQARGEIVVFSHDDVEVLSGNFAATLRRALDRFDLVGVAGTTRLVGPSWILAAYPYVFGQIVIETRPPELPYSLQVFDVPTREIGGIQALDGVFLAARRATLDRVPFDEETFDGFHLYDVDFSYRCHLAGLRVGVVGDIHLLHRSEGHFESTWREHALRFAAKFPGRDWSAPMPRFTPTVIAAVDRAHLRELMTPPFWT